MSLLDYYRSRGFEVSHDASDLEQYPENEGRIFWRVYLGDFGEPYIDLEFASDGGLRAGRLCGVGNMRESSNPATIRRWTRYDARTSR